MKRIVVIGCSGSGKSTLARALGERTGLPVFHLDALYWQPGWRTPADESAFQARVREISEQPCWIIDGGFTTGNAEVRFARADTVYLFDLPRWVCLLRVFKRFVRYAGRTRPDLAPGCGEKIDFEFYRYIWGYRKKSLPKVLHYVEAHFKGQLIRITSRRQQAQLHEALRIGVRWAAGPTNAGRFRRCGDIPARYISPSIAGNARTSAPSQTEPEDEPSMDSFG
jgi:adenylate kinase family enzyme